jgi:hypothetical protein
VSIIPWKNECIITVQVNGGRPRRRKPVYRRLGMDPQSVLKSKFEDHWTKVSAENRHGIKMRLDDFCGR